MTGYGWTPSTAGPDPVAAGLADYDNQHPYPIWGHAPGEAVTRASLNNTSSSTTPAVFTETGYSTNLSKTGQSGGVDQTVQAKYTLDLLFDAAAAGISKTYLYELLDAYPTGSRQGNEGFGLFDEKGAPKLAATAIHNMTSILRDTGPGAAASATVPDYTVAGLPATGKSMTLQNSDGSTSLVIWAEPPIWDMVTQKEIAAPPQTVTVTLDAAHTSVQVFDPLAGTGSIASYTDTGTVSVTVTDHPIIIKVSAGRTVVPAPQAPVPVAPATAPTAMTCAQYLGDTAAGGNPISIVDSAANLQNAFDALSADPRVTSISVADGNPLVLTSARYKADQGALGKMTSYGLQVTDVAAAGVSLVEKTSHLASLSVSDTAANLSVRTLAALGSDVKVTAISVSDQPLVMTLAEYRSAAAGLGKLTGGSGVSITDTAANLTGAALATWGPTPRCSR